MSIDSMVLGVVTFVPTAGALLLAVAPRRDNFSRRFALAVSLLTFFISLRLPAHFDPAQSGFQFEVNRAWISSPNIHFHLGIDGISLWLVLLTTFLVPLSVLISWRSVKSRVKEFFILLLLLETGVIGVFVSLDMFLFYVFWEATLIPMTLLIGVYGHERRIYAAIKFFLFTMIASVFMLVAILWLYSHSGTFDYVLLKQMLEQKQIPSSLRVGELLFFGFFIAFAVKVPIFPLHTWLPDAHVEAPTAGSVLLAGLLLKMGTYGLLRFNVGLFPAESREHAPWIVALAIVGIIYGALVTLVQTNLKKLLAYSSVSHLGFVVLGIFTFTEMGTNGAVYQMLNHGVSTGALFVLAGIVYERRHTFQISEYGGLATPMPKFATLFLIITLASIGLPLMNGFVGEFLILGGAFIAKPIYGVLATSAIIWSAAYMLWLYQRVFFGPVNNELNRNLVDATPREQLTLLPLAAMTLVMGVASPLWLRDINPAVQTLLKPAVSTGIQITKR